MNGNHKPDWAYVNRLRAEMQRELEGFHLRINETEELRYLEEPIPLAPQEKRSGQEVRIGLTGELIENVKSALTNNPPKVTLKPLRTGDKARDNGSTREEFWNQVLIWLALALLELADGQSGLGIGIIKGSSYPWPKEERKRKKNKKGEFTETPKEHTDRIRALKRRWGIPYRAITIHPLTFYFRLGAGNVIVEAIEHSWKPRRQVLKDYEQPLDSLNVTASELAATVGQPEEVIRPLPYGTSTETMALVTEYWSLADDLYQVYINGQLVHEDEGDPGVRYFVATGRVTSSKDPDKFGFGVAEILRHNEPIINAVCTRMAEAASLLVDKRLTLETPEGFVPEEELDASGNLVPKVYKFEKGKAEALPSQVKVVDPFEGVENIYAAMPFLELLLRISGQHGVAPIFKGKSPGAAGSGYRDVSLYAMAKSQFAYILKSYCNCVAEFVAWLEEQVVKDNKEVFIGDVSLKPSDVRDWPAIISVKVDPDLPQNIIPMGQFYDRMWAEGHIPSRLVVEKGMKEEQPQDLRRERDLEDLKGMMKPILYNHVLQVVGVLPPTPPMPGGPGGGDVTAITTPPGAQPVQEPPGKGESAQASAGAGRGGQPRVPPEVSQGISEEEGLA